MLNVNALATLNASRHSLSRRPKTFSRRGWHWVEAHEKGVRRSASRSACCWPKDFSEPTGSRQRTEVREQPPSRKATARRGGQRSTFDVRRSVLDVCCRWC